MSNADNRFKELLDTLDASVYTGDALTVGENSDLFNFYLARWNAVSNSNYRARIADLDVRVTRLQELMGE